MVASHTAVPMGTAKWLVRATPHKYNLADMQGTRAAYVAYRKGRLISWWSNTIPAISQPQEGQLYGWLPLSNAYGIFYCRTRPNLIA